MLHLIQATLGNITRVLRTQSVWGSTYSLNADFKRHFLIRKSIFSEHYLVVHSLLNKDKMIHGGTRETFPNTNLEN